MPGTTQTGTGLGEQEWIDRSRTVIKQELETASTTTQRRQYNDEQITKTTKTRIQIFGVKGLFIS